MLVTRGYVQWQCRTPHLECLLSTTMQMDFSSLGVAAFISFIHLHFMKPEGIASNRSAMLSAKSTSRRKNPCTAIQAIETPTKKGTSKKWKVLQGAQGHSTSSKWQQQGAKQRELRAIHHNRLTFQRLSAGSNMKAHTKKRTWNWNKLCVTHLRSRKKKAYESETCSNAKNCYVLGASRSSCG